MEPHEMSFRVRYAETDQMGVAYHANYLVWMEMGRVEYCRAKGVRYRDVEEQEGLALAVAEVECRYRSPARYDDEVTVKTWIDSANRRIVKFCYELYTQGRLLATGFTRHVWVGRDFRPASLPEKYFEVFGVMARP